MATVDIAASGSGLTGFQQTVHLPWEENRLSIDYALPKAEIWGFHRGAYTPVETETLTARVVRIPPGQASPAHRLTRDVAFVQLAGELIISAGRQRFLAGPNDLYTIPGGIPRKLFNPGITDAFFLSIQSKSEVDDGGMELLEVGPEAWDAPAGLEIFHLAWKDYRRRVVWRGGLSERQGYKRGVFPFLETEDMRGHAVRVPAGQGSPWHTFPGVAIFVGMVGEIEVYADNKAYSLGPMDLLMLPGPNYALQNIGLDDAVYFSLGPTGIPREQMIYYEPAVPGNPLAGPGVEVAP